MTSYALLILGLVILTYGADFLVRGASAIASRFGLSELVIGLTVIAFGTSAPELAVSIKSALAGQSGIALGNVIGSNIFNVAAILGLSAMICPLAVHLKIIRMDMPVLLGVSILFTALLTSGGGLARWEGGLLVSGLILYLAWSLLAGKTSERNQLEETEPKLGLGPGLGAVILGLAMLVMGAQLLVDNAVVIARNFGVSETVIGLTVVAAGTSLPELATSVVAALKKQTDIAIGNVVGSNIFNILGIAGITAVITPVGQADIQWRDLLFMLGAAFLLLPLMRTGFTLARWEGAALFIGFLAYLRMVWP